MTKQKNSSDVAGSTQLTGLNKRQQIAKANKSIFVWVSIAAAIIALSLVALQFIVRQGFFNNKIISSLSETNKTIIQNKENATELKRKIDNLQADNNLASIKASPSDNNLKVILDALPTTGDTTTISNSLYSQILNKSGVEISSISVGDNTATVASALTPVASEPQVSQAPTFKTVPFNLATKGSLDQSKTVLLDIERVIRPFSIEALSISAGADNRLSVTIKGVTFYLEASTVQLGTEVIKP